MLDFIKGYVKHVKDHLEFRKKLKSQGLPMTKEIGLFINKEGHFVYASPLLSPRQFYQLRQDLLKSRKRAAERAKAKELKSPINLLNTPHKPSNTFH